MIASRGDKKWKRRKCLMKRRGRAEGKKLRKDLEDDWSILARSKKLTRMKFWGWKFPRSNESERVWSHHDDLVKGKYTNSCSERNDEMCQQKPLPVSSPFAKKCESGWMFGFFRALVFFHVLWFDGVWFFLCELCWVNVCWFNSINYSSRWVVCSANSRLKKFYPSGFITSASKLSIPISQQHFLKSYKTFQASEVFFIFCWSNFLFAILL